MNAFNGVVVTGSNWPVQRDCCLKIVTASFNTDYNPAQPELGRRKLKTQPKLRKTKVIATIGPACDNLEDLKSMILAGINVARLNFLGRRHARRRDPYR